MSEPAPALCTRPDAGPEGEGERATLLFFLAAQRRSVLAVIDGLDDVSLQRIAAPSGWTPLGLIEHLGHAERFWFQEVVTGEADVLPWSAASADEKATPLSTNRPTDEVLAFYRDQCARSDAVLSTTLLTAPPQGAPPAEMADLAPDVRTVVLHMIEETARHAGHLDIVRELIDGRTGLGPR